MRGWTAHKWGLVAPRDLKSGVHFGMGIVLHLLLESGITSRLGQ